MHEKRMQTDCLGASAWDPKKQCDDEKLQLPRCGIGIFSFFRHALTWVCKSNKGVWTASPHQVHHVSSPGSSKDHLLFFCTISDIINIDTKDGMVELKRVLRNPCTGNVRGRICALCPKSFIAYIYRCKCSLKKKTGPKGDTPLPPTVPNY